MNTTPFASDSGLNLDHLEAAFERAGLSLQTVGPAQKVMTVGSVDLVDLVRVFAELPGRAAPPSALTDAGITASQPSEASPLADICRTFKWRTDGDTAVLAERLVHHIRELRAGIKARDALLAAAPSLPAAAPAPLDADEMTRLRRLMKALGHVDAFEEGDDYVRGILCTVLGQATGRIEGTLPGPAAAPAAGDELRDIVRALTTLLDAGEWADLPMDDPDAIALWDAVEKLVAANNEARAAHQSAQEQADMSTQSTGSPDVSKSGAEIDMSAQAAQHDAGGIPEILFDGNAVYEEIVRKVGKSYCGNPSVVSDTLDALVRLMRSGAASPVVRAPLSATSLQGSLHAQSEESAGVPHSDLLCLFLRAAYPVAASIDPRGYSWSEAYLDQARSIALAQYATGGLLPDEKYLVGAGLPVVGAQQAHAGADEALAAARWNALLGSARIRPLGSAGIVNPQAGHYAHMGLEIWTTGDWSDCTPDLRKRLAYDQKVGIDWLTKYADIAIEAQRAAIRAAQEGESNAEG